MPCDAVAVRSTFVDLSVFKLKMTKADVKEMLSVVLSTTELLWQFQDFSERVEYQLPGRTCVVIGDPLKGITIRGGSDSLNSTLKEKFKKYMGYQYQRKVADTLKGYTKSTSRAADGSLVLEVDL